MNVLDRFRLDGKVAVVTGASSGLGPAIASALADAGADVALAARRFAPMSSLAEQIRSRGRRAIAVATDVARRVDCRTLIDKTVAELGRVDVLINNAGVATAVPALRETAEQWQTVLDVNLSGCYWMAQAAADAMRGGGSVINISSVLAVTTAGLPQAAYSASKAGLHGLTRDLAQQWSGRLGIRVNALAPGFFRTEMTAHYADGYAERLKKRILLDREGDADELAAAVTFLASDASSYITGQVLVVDGGLAIT